MEVEDKQRNDIKWLLETLCHLQDWLNEEDRTLKQSELDKLVKRYKDLQSSNKILISKTNKVEMQYKLEQDLDQVSFLLCCLDPFGLTNCSVKFFHSIEFGISILLNSDLREN